MYIIHTSEHVLRKIHHWTFGRKISERLFLGIFFSHHPFLRVSSLAHFTDCPALTPNFRRMNFLTPLFRILPKFYIFSLENYDDLFLVIVPFFTIFCLSVFFSYFTLRMTPPIPIFCTLYTPCIHTHMLFARFCTLLCALVTVDNA